MKVCSTKGCATLTTGTRCDACDQARQRDYDDRRGSASARGYGRRWYAYRARFLKRHPRCGDRPDGAPATQDSRCKAEGRVAAANVVDHIVPVSGPDDPSFFKPTAHQALCDRCHNAKRQRESRGAGGLKVFGGHPQGTAGQASFQVRQHLGALAKG